MKKNITKIIVAIIGILIIMISIITVLLVKMQNNEEIDGVLGEDIDENEYTVSKTSSLIEFEIARYGIQRYINYCEMNNMQAISEIADEKISFNISEDNSTEFFINEMYDMSLYSEARYFIKGDTSTSKDCYYIILDMDFENYTYKLQEITEDKFNEEIKKEHNENNTKIISIDKKNYNAIKEVGIDETYSLLNGYVNQYKSYIENNLERAYELLDEEYKEKKFEKSYEKFVNYANNIKTQLINYNLMSYTKTDEGYQIEVGEEEAFIIKTEELGKYTILLDTYTIKTPEFIEEYNELTDAEKIGTNVDKIFKMINHKEYEKIYDCISEAYRKNNFSSYTDFEKFMNEKFFNYNYVGEINVTEEQQYYVAKITYSNGFSSVAEYRNISIIIKLNDDADFIMSFANE